MQINNLNKMFDAFHVWFDEKTCHGFLKIFQPEKSYFEIFYKVKQVTRLSTQISINIVDIKSIFILYHVFSWYLCKPCSKNQIRVLNFKKLCKFIFSFAFHWSIFINNLFWFYYWGLKVKQVYVLSLLKS